MSLQPPAGRARRQQSNESN